MSQKQRVNTIEDIKKILHPVLQDSPVQKAIVFGSFARGDQTDGSDIDLVIDSGRVLCNLNFFEFSYKLTQLFVRQLDVFEMMEIKNPSKMYERIKQEGVIVYKRA